MWKRVISKKRFAYFLSSIEWLLIRYPHLKFKSELQLRQALVEAGKSPKHMELLGILIDMSPKTVRTIEMLFGLQSFDRHVFQLLKDTSIDVSAENNRLPIHVIRRGLDRYIDNVIVTSIINHTIFDPEGQQIISYTHYSTSTRMVDPVC